MDELITPIIKLLKVLSDSTRLKIIEFLRNGEQTANDIQTQLDKGQSTISQHLKVLINADLIQARPDGVKKYYKIKHPQIFNVISTINSFISETTKNKIDDLTSLDIIDTLY